MPVFFQRHRDICSSKRIHLQGKLEFEVHWMAYQLQPLAPPEGVPKAVFMEQKFKGQAQYLMEKKQARALAFPSLGSRKNPCKKACKDKGLAVI